MCCCQMLKVDVFVSFFALHLAITNVKLICHQLIPKKITHVTLTVSSIKQEVTAINHTW